MRFWRDPVKRAGVSCIWKAERQFEDIDTYWRTLYFCRGGAFYTAFYTGETFSAHLG